MKLFKFIAKITPPGAPVVPSFKEASSPDFTFRVAGIDIGAHSDGGPWGMTQYLTLQHAGHAPVSAVPDAPSGGLMLAGLVALLVLRRLGMARVRALALVPVLVLLAVLFAVIGGLVGQRRACDV